MMITTNNNGGDNVDNSVMASNSYDLRRITITLADLYYKVGIVQSA